MNIISLNGSWNMRATNDTAYLQATVPGSVLATLLAHQQIEDPFWRTNEYATRDLFEKDYLYERTFTLEAQVLQETECALVCYGLDTLATIVLNGTEIAKTDNMHRTWRFPVKEHLRLGENTIQIYFDSPLQYLRNALANCDEKIGYTAAGSTAGNGFLRKSHCMFGWDWGPQLPDAGIWRGIELQAFSTVRIDDVRLQQVHTAQSVQLTAHVSCTNLQQGDAVVQMQVTAPDGQIMQKTQTALLPAQTTALQCDIVNPQLWWPNGYGAQPLYQVQVCVMHGDTVCDSKCLTIGLRTLTVSTEADEWGNEFCFVINGAKIFAMGADYIPEDSVLSRVTPARTERLIADCAKANFNCIRVWGGAHYPEDAFFDLCDRYGMIVWQDFMFACNVYRFTKEFEQNVVAELRDNIRRIRHHACLGLWCGNNEMEFGWVDWDRVKYHSAALKADYIKQFEYVLPQVAQEEDPDTFYWRASPSSTGCFDKPNDFNRGDVHYWDVWHGLLPFTDYRNHYFRFCSEFGFQSFPCEKTVASFTLPQDRNIFSRVMESHQKNGTANGKILFYLADYFQYPKDFSSMLYVSQLLQALAIQYGVEHWRRNRGRCMGAIYWQLNDCWPVASWASVDYFGRWKALHYAAKRFFAPRMVSACEEGTQVAFYAHNDSLQDYIGQLQIRVCKNDFTVLHQAEYPVNCTALSADCVHTQDFSSYVSDAGDDSVYVAFTLQIDGAPQSSGTVLFVRPKHLQLEKPQYTSVITETDTQFVLRIMANTFAPFTALSLADADVVFSDNFFDITAPEGVEITIDKSDCTAVITQAYLYEHLQITSLADSM